MAKECQKAEAKKKGGAICTIELTRKAILPERMQTPHRPKVAHKVHRKRNQHSPKKAIRNKKRTKNKRQDVHQPSSCQENLGLVLRYIFRLLFQDKDVWFSTGKKHPSGVQLQAKVMKTITGKQLVGLEYNPQFPYFKGNKNSFKILGGNFVTEENGTGIVHMAPAFGEDDFNVCKENDIKFVCPVDEGGRFTNQVWEIDYKLAGKDAKLSISGLQVLETNEEIIKYLKGNGLWVKTEEYIHNYPHCWRTDTPLIYKVMSSWYVEVTKIKNRMVEVNQSINWVPSNVKGGIFGKWLENARDWSISRNRFWGCPVPVWKSTDPKYPRTDVYGSIEELEKDFSKHYKEQYGEDLKITDLHRPFIDKLTRPNPSDPTGKSMMVRVEDVLDCWFESGSMPFASIHYPFEYIVNGKMERNAEENISWFNKHFPADFIVEYVAQTRGWFYTLVVLGVALFDKAPFSNCISHGVVLDSKGEKLSKRLKNYPNPLEMFDLYGSDAMRFAMMRSGAMKGKEINIDIEGKFVKDIARDVLSSIWNTFSFFKVYLESDGLGSIKNRKEAFFSTTSNHPMDRYLLSELHVFLSSFKTALNNYDTPAACGLVERFIELMNNWYIRRSKKRFWSSIRLTGENYQYGISTINEYKTLTNQQLEEIAKFSVENVVLDYQENYGQYVNSAIADAVLHHKHHPWRINVNQPNQKITIIDRDKQTAYSTLYTVLLSFITAIAPLTPFLSEKIYLELTE